MPYGNNMSGPADWAAQKQAQEAENFSRIISLMLGLKQNQTEQDWKQKEYSMGQQKYSDSLRQQGVENTRADKSQELQTAWHTTDDARQADQAKSTAENNKLLREQAALNEKDKVKNWAVMDENRDLERQDRAISAKERATKATSGNTNQKQFGLVTRKLASIEKNKRDIETKIEKLSGTEWSRTQNSAQIQVLQKELETASSLYNSIVPIQMYLTRERDNFLGPEEEATLLPPPPNAFSGASTSPIPKYGPSSPAPRTPQTATPPPTPQYSPENPPPNMPKDAADFWKKYPSMSYGDLMLTYQQFQQEKSSGRGRRGR